MNDLDGKLYILDKLIRQCEQSNLVSFAYQDVTFSIRFSKVEGEMAYQTDMIQKETMENASELKVDNTKTGVHECVITDTSKMDKQDNEDITIIVAPIVGMIEFSNQIKLESNDAHVDKGDVLCSVEAMKIYNDITSPVSGTIVEILVKNSSLVEYEQPILKIRVDKNE